ncbi:MAG: hypothetical protein ACOYZ8_00515 [Chloroflexota bacterium]
MKKRPTYIPLFFALLVAITNACAGNSNMVSSTKTPSLPEAASVPESQSLTQQECIPPIATLAYRPDLPPVLSEDETPIFPSGEWQYVADLPVTDESIEELVARSSDEIWALFTHRGGLWRYRPSSGEWKEYTSIDKFENIIPIIMLTPSLTEHNELWGVGYFYKESSIEREIPRSFFFSRYNEETDQFEFVQNDEEILMGYNISYLSIRQDQNGIFWLMAQKKDQQFPDLLIDGQPFTLFSFDPFTGKIESHGEFPYSAKYFQIARNGSIWMLVDDEEKLFLQQYLPSTNETRIYRDLPPTVSETNRYVGMMYFDRHDNLWIEDRGWVDFSDSDKPVWYQVIRSSVFLTDRAEGETRIVWARPNQMYESSNGLYWFGSFYGLVRLDPESGEWCKFTNGRSPFAEDNQQNIWIAVFGRLYRYSLLH